MKKFNIVPHTMSDKIASDMTLMPVENKNSGFSMCFFLVAGSKQKMKSFFTMYISCPTKVKIRIPPSFVH